ncbi:peptidase M48 Ste24p [Halothece sp. PCC 7418]|uniref:M48 family metallopeptidase n=1 Tax=Halothece sp. (strain PCC 7418) TaxID=65093 RepID=UPI0002A06D17|nr:M48 family metallopeptidase [Halothece sp. PCC 7418]AFZ44862.1 peptidase M48 Ste24p [Halothece sp. PCC 7418]
MKRPWNVWLLSLSLAFIPTVAWSEATEESSPQEKPEITVVEDNELLPDLTGEEYDYLATLMKADQLYQAGKKDSAIALYQKVKPPFPSQTNNSSRQAYTDVSDLPPDGKVYWRYGEAEFNPKLKSKTLAPLALLVEKHPSFMPGHLRYAEALVYFDQTEAGIEHLESAVSRYPQQLTLVEALLPLYEENEQWLNASLTARQFALLNAEHSKADYYSTLADQHLETYERNLRISLRENAFASIITGALGFALTGSLAGPLSAIETTALLLQGESAVGDRISNRLEENLPLLEDEEVKEYVTEIGKTVTQYSGRDSFDYEFHIIMDENLNAFALPGGKVFINAGAILKTESEAELAGLIAHEIAHAVLSHGFQLVTEGNVLANVSQFVPYGGTAANLIVLNYSRKMERQADALGTRLLASSKYAADGVYNLMVALEKEYQDQSRPPVWLSTHPNTKERVENIKTQILENGYDRYRYEGIARHLQIQEKTAELLAEYQAQEGDENSED